jgi:hypothetical protein
MKELINRQNLIKMNNVKINNIGFGIQTLDTTNITYGIFHLGAKYGAIKYNIGLKEGAIVVNTDENVIEVNVDRMNEIVNRRIK